jgi:hypothetical protein
MKIDRSTLGSPSSAVMVTDRRKLLRAKQIMTLGVGKWLKKTVIRYELFDRHLRDLVGGTVLPDAVSLG